MKIYSQRLRKVDLLSQGDDASVWLARDEVSGAQVVLKEYTRDAPGLQKELEQIVSLTRQLEDSGFLAAQDLVLQQGRLVGYTGRLIEFGSLNQIAGELDDPSLLSVLQSVCQSLAYLHSLDYLHCDIKPDNILIECQGGVVRPYVTDLGLAARRGAQFVTSIRGTDEFIAPEQVEGKPLTEGVDIYSFGKMLINLGPVFRSARLAAAISELGRNCSGKSISDRPPSFWVVHDSIRHIASAEGRTAPPTMLPPPLRDAGVRLRVNNLLRHLKSGTASWHGLCLVTGQVGIGKSKILREFSLNRQLAGEETIRVTGVGSLVDLSHAIRSAFPVLGTGGHRRSRWVIAETDAHCSLTTHELGSLQKTAEEHQVALLLESRVSQTVSLGDQIRQVRILPFSLRECIIASSHLQNNPSLSVANGRALQIATGGIPRLVRQYLKTQLMEHHGPQDDEPVDFDRLDAPTRAYWNDRFMNLPPSLQTILGRASVFHDKVPSATLSDSAVAGGEAAEQADDLAEQNWLQRLDTATDDPVYRFVCRSARNFVRHHFQSERLRQWAAGILATAPAREAGGARSLSDSWELQRLAKLPTGGPSVGELWNARSGITDTKLATYALLQAYRHLRASGAEELCSLSSDISDGFAELGSVRRQKRWAAVAFNQMRQQEVDSGLSLAAARSICRLHDLSGEFAKKQASLVALLDNSEIDDSHVRGFLLSELGTAHLLQSSFKEANARYFEAFHLLERVAPESEEYVRNLNRLGLSLMRIGHYTAARKHLEHCRKLAQHFGFDHIARLSLGNLAILERALGNPQAAMRCSRRVLEGYRSAQEPLKYLMALPDRVICLVDLGFCYQATRTAQLAVRLANLHSDEFELRYALNNLGWVLTMQGEVGRARENLEAAIRLYHRTGDYLEAARSRLNIAWNLLLAGDLRRAEELCKSALDEIGRQNDLHGQCEALRILAQAAIMRQDLAAAAECLNSIPSDEPTFSPRDRAETSLAQLNLYLWMGQDSAAERIIEALADDSIISDVHPLRCDFGRLHGLWHILQGNHDAALDLLGPIAVDCRRAGRVDKLLDTMIVLALLAGRMRNWPVGLRYLRTIKKMTNSMRGQLP